MIRPESTTREKLQPNLYPLWYIISEESKKLLWDYQFEHYNFYLTIPRYPTPEISVDYAKEMKKKPYKPVRVK